METNLKNIGIHDLPIFDDSLDLFEVMPYIEALSDFIRQSATPITIALQGGWGTGKTSFMNLINRQLEPVKRLGEETGSIVNTESPVVTVNFNTWQYTQFNLEQNLGISFLSYIINKLTEDLKGDENNFVSEASKAIKGLAKFGVNVVLAQAGMQPVSDEESKNDEVMDPAQAIETLRESLGEIVKKIAKKYAVNGEDARLVVFIDDLDRLKPSIAVSLLEVIKLFLDIEGCIFVLAVDNRVIEEGIAEVKQTSIAKTKSFLDKMIQVPFKIPVEIYNYKRFLTDNLGVLSENDELSNELQNLIQFSVGSNPRAMKRLINNFYLNNKVNMIIDNQTITSQNDQCILIAIICMQLACQPLYITMRYSDSKLELLNKVVEEGLFVDFLREEFIELESLNLFEEDTENSMDSYDRFLDYLRTILLLTVNKDRNGVLEEADLSVYNKILKRSDMTNVSQSQVKMNNDEDLGEIVNVKLLDFINNIKKYQLEKKQTLVYKNSHNDGIYNMKEGFQVIVNDAVKGKEHIEKLKSVDGLKNSNIARTMYFRLLPESEWSDAEKKYKTLEFGNQEIGTVKLGHSFGNAESARQLYRVLNYLNSNIVNDIYLRARPVE